MIARIWRGAVRREDGDVYADYIRETGFSAYAETAGNRGAWLLRCDTDERTEFITFSLWESLDDRPRVGVDRGEGVRRRRGDPPLPRHLTRACGRCRRCELPDG
jgi:hypothetical protein